jgi:hypothetical protein
MFTPPELKRDQTVYRDLFSSWSDVQGAFCMTQPQPDCVLLAEYEDENYSGFARVVYFDKGKLWHVSGGHCSCYGLEDQWEPEEISPEMMRHMAAQPYSSWKPDEVERMLAMVGL